MKRPVFERLPENFAPEFIATLRHCKLIGIHGRNSSGKSSLARDLILQTMGTHIEVDDCLEHPPDGRTYLERVQVGHVIEKFNTSEQPVFLDSFIVLDVLEKIHMQADHILTSA